MKSRACMKKLALLAKARNAIETFTDEEEGVTAIEYALLAGLIAMVIVGSVGALGTSVSNMWTVVADAVAAATSL